MQKLNNRTLHSRMIKSDPSKLSSEPHDCWTSLSFLLGTAFPLFNGALLCLREPKQTHDFTFKPHLQTDVNKRMQLTVTQLYISTH